MESLVLRILWHIIHAIVNIIEVLYHFGFEFRENLSNFIKNINKDNLLSTKESEIQRIERSVQDLEKIPEHIVVILDINNEKDVDLSKLTSLIFWSMNSGVFFISFYDYKGILKHRLASSFHRVIRDKLNISDNENIVWGPNHQTSSSSDIKFPHRNGYKRHIVINLYSSEDSYGMFGRLLKNETKNIDEEPPLDSKTITIEQVDKRLGRLFGHIPDPELAVYFGNVSCTAGLLPWHIRLTEFIQISYKQQHLSLDKYLRVLYKYAKCEQRLGK